MEKLGEESAAKFISALIKSVQTLCHGYLDFQNGVEIIGHINLSVDKGNSLDYILKEKVCKNAENSTLFISNSFHAEPKPEQEVSGKTSQSGNQLCQNNESPDTAESGRLSSAISSISTALTESRERSRRNSGAKDSNSSHSDTQPSTAKRKASEDDHCEFRPAKISYHDKLSHVTSESSHLGGSSSPVDSKEALQALRTAEDDMSETVLPQTASVRSDCADIGVNLAGSVLEPIESRNNPDLPERDEDSDGDLEVTFIKEEYVEGEGSACDFDGQQFSRGPHQRASDGMPDPSLYSLGSQSSSASATYVPSAAGQQFHSGSSASATSQPQPGPSGMRDTLWTTRRHTVRENKCGALPYSNIPLKANNLSLDGYCVQADSHPSVYRTGGSGHTSGPLQCSAASNSSTVCLKQSSLTPEIQSPFQRRLFRCPFCDYRNSRMYNLKRHIRCHTGQMFQCSLCAAEYNCKYKLQQHLLLKHQM